ncbi:uncharacterized protein SCODWIG_00979 [Saccharomycodes ludwigii]|uniref:PhoD-like phosphatase domain-containing protein n=1 Tax=Saccharomycodes ludwigii TaxID=36035 RepID=A0A376B3E9_9ASCO|nr:uncharacterized protein SCODWIG_00979 [Saccharomycodes ludwigii]
MTQDKSHNQYHNINGTIFDNWNYTRYKKTCNPSKDYDSPLSENFFLETVSANNGIVCGPILRLISITTNKDNESIYKGSILLICNGNNQQPKPIKFFIQKDNSSLTTFIPKKVVCFHKDFLYKDSDPNFCLNFYRYEFEITLNEQNEQLITYSIDDNHLPHYRFYIPSAKQNCNTISYSCNGFSLNTDTSSFNGSLWYDVLRRHSSNHYHVMLGGGDQLYSDRVKIECPKFLEWLHYKNDEHFIKQKYPENAKSSKIKHDIHHHKLLFQNFEYDTEFSKQIRQFYLKNYLEWFGYGYWKGTMGKTLITQLPIAFATIPSINIYDDHDIIDGFGSYPDKTMNNEVFKNLGKVAYEYYMLFQQQVSSPFSSDEQDVYGYFKEPSWVLGSEQGCKFIGERSHSIFTKLGPDLALLGLDCRTERSLKEILSKKTYDTVFARLQKEYNSSRYKHLYLMLGVPIMYPRFVWLENIFDSKLLTPIKWASRKGWMFHGLVNEFNGDIELLDDLNDHWCSFHHKAERNYLMARLQDFAAKNCVRITILSGDVHLTCVGQFEPSTKAVAGHKSSEDPRLMYNIISSAITNTPPPDAMVKLLTHRSKSKHKFSNDTDEKMCDVFKSNRSSNGSLSEKFINQRNWCDLVYNSETDYVQSKIYVEKDRTSIDSETKSFKLDISPCTEHNVKLDHGGMRHVGQF